MRRLTDLLARGVAALCAAALAIMALVVAFQIIGRYVPFITRALWTEEISRMCLMWLVFLGAALAVRTSEHFLIDLIPDRLGDGSRRVIATVGLLGIAAVAVAMLIGSIGFVETGLARTSTTSGISLVYSFAAPLVSAVQMQLITVQVWREAMADPRGAGLQQHEIDAVEEAGDAPRVGAGEGRSAS
ncbi:TRAP transporter small permease [Pseudactinotalea sp.]|uniref:TRAP transporter small permease n=1 Tax=Pseudactinotalea sp. TaxID=1926260 RepID=UPI003B3BBE63